MWDDHAPLYNDELHDVRAPTSNKYKCTYSAMRTESSFRWQFNGASAPATPHKRQKRTCTERRWGKRVHGSIRTLERRGRDTHGEQTDAWIRATGWTPATWQFRWPRRYSLTVTPPASIFDSAYLLAFPFTYLVTYLRTRQEHTRYSLCRSLSVDIRDIDVVTAISSQREKALAIIRERTCW